MSDTKQYRRWIRIGTVVLNIAVWISNIVTAHLFFFYDNCTRVCYDAGLYMILVASCLLSITFGLLGVSIYFYLSSQDDQTMISHDLPAIRFRKMAKKLMFVGLVCFICFLVQSLCFLWSVDGQKKLPPLYTYPYFYYTVVDLLPVVTLFFSIAPQTRRSKLGASVRSSSSMSAFTAMSNDNNYFGGVDREEGKWVETSSYEGIFEKNGGSSLLEAKRSFSNNGLIAHGNGKYSPISTIGGKGTEAALTASSSSAGDSGGGGFKRNNGDSKGMMILGRERFWSSFHTSGGERPGRPAALSSALLTGHDDNSRSDSRGTAVDFSL
mmetsp:Transcript_10462/g.16947  ORF Transcript_10462/g.16947 Transcript_10462/m.16947 type:complete len:324 (-) Transcript_10462:75-1046(-)